MATPTSPRNPQHTNRLIQSTSPYLLQHQHNPVDWYPWGERRSSGAAAQQADLSLGRLSAPATGAT